MPPSVQDKLRCQQPHWPNSTSQAIHEQHTYYVSVPCHGKVPGMSRTVRIHRESIWHSRHPGGMPMIVPPSSNKLFTQVRLWMRSVKAKHKGKRMSYICAMLCYIGALLGALYRRGTKTHPRAAINGPPPCMISSVPNEPPLTLKYISATNGHTPMVCDFFGCESSPWLFDLSVAPYDLYMDPLGC